MEIENIELVKAVEKIFDAAYKGDDLTKRVADILGMKNISGWSVIDTYENLALVHYDDTADMKECGHLRGVLIDTEKGDIIADSFGFTPSTVVDEIVPEGDKLVFVDSNKNRHVFDVDDNITQIFEGVVIRVIWYNSTLYRITHKKIIPHRSHWGNPSKCFISLYETAGGPTAEQLFDTTKPFSDTCYHFMVVDPSLLVATRQRVSAPYIVCLEKQTIKLSREASEIASGNATFEVTDKVGGAVNKSMIHMPKKLTIADANKHLKSGYYKDFEMPDKRLSTGEGVIIYHKENGIITNVLKVNSKSYDWRCSMRGGNPNYVNQFYCLLGCAYPEIGDEKAWDLFREKFIMFPLYDVDQLKEQYEKNKVIITLPVEEIDRKLYEKKEDRIHLLWINYVLSLPANLQGDSLEIFGNFNRDRKNLCCWLATMESNVKNIEDLPISKNSGHIKRIINASRVLSKRDISEGKNFNHEGKEITYPELIKKKINNLIKKEKGSSLYGMVKDMKTPPKPKEEKKEKEEKTI